MEKLIHRTDYGWDETREPNPGEVWDKVILSLQLLLRAEGLVAHLDNLQELNSVLQRRIDRVSEGLSFPIGDFSSVLVHADNVEAAFLEDLLRNDDPVFLRYRHFNAIDAYLFPLEWVSGLREKDVINVCRISPSDAQQGFSRRDAKSKTAGDSLAHFSAFFKRTWRANDIMWGRLDGLCELVETLLTGPAIESAMNNDDARQRARDVLLPSDGASPLDAWFRDSSEAAVAKMKSWVAAVTDPDPWTRTQALTSFYSDQDQQSGESIRTLLIEMAQFRILHESLPDVFEDSIREQAEWKQIRRESSDPARLQWLGTDVGMDSTALNAVAALGGRKLLEELEEGRPQELSPKESRLGRMFSDFQIGSEEVWGGGVPLVVLGEIGLKTLLVLRSCLLGSFSERTGAKIRSSTLFRWGLDLPLRGFYGAFTLFRGAPSLQPAIVGGGTILSILALFVGLRWREAIIEPSEGFSRLWFCVFIVVPLAWLTAVLYQLTRSRASQRLGGSLRNAFVAVCTAAPLISVTMLFFGLTDLFRDWWNGTLEPSRDLKFLMIVLYGIVPFVLSFLGGYLAMQENRREPDIDDLASALGRMTESDLQDVCDRVGENHQVTPENRAKVAKALTVAAEMNNGMGTLTRAIRAVSPGALD